MRNRNRILRAFAAVLLGLGVVAGALDMGALPSEFPLAVAAPPAPRHYSEGEMPEYPGSFEFPIGEGLAMNGVPLRISHFSTGDAAERVRDYYLGEFKRFGLEPQAGKAEDGTVNVSAVARDGLTQYAVAIAPRSKGCEVFPSAVPIDAELQGTVPDADVPLSPTSVGLMRVTSKSERGGTVAYQEPQSSAGEVAAHIEETMVARGWSVEERVPGAGGARTLVLKRGNYRGHFTITAYRHAPKGAAVFAQYGRGEE